MKRKFSIPCVAITLSLFLVKLRILPTILIMFQDSPNVDPEATRAKTMLMEKTSRIIPSPTSTLASSFRENLKLQIVSHVKQEIRRIKLPGDRHLAELSVENGGTPLRTLLVAHFRSGSSFLGEILSSHPGTYYLFEPDFAVHHENVMKDKVTNGSFDDGANSVLKSLFTCSFNILDKDVLSATLNSEWFFFRNKRLLDCTSAFETRILEEACMNVEFLTDICRAFPVIAAKTVLYRLDSLEELLKSVNQLKVLYLIRDPRATMNSRLHEDWCLDKPECGNLSLLCNDLVHEYHIAQELKAKHPDSFMVVRYEDLVTDCYNLTQKIFSFLGYAYTNPTQRYIRSHTKKKQGGGLSTYRDIRGQLQHWMSDMASNYGTVKIIQDSCKDAMELWGYEMVSEADFKQYQLKVNNLTSNKS